MGFDWANDIQCNLPKSPAKFFPARILSYNSYLTMASIRVETGLGHPGHILSGSSGSDLDIKSIRV